MKRLLLPALLLALLLPAPGRAEDLKPVGEKDRCPVCGMFVAPYRNWLGTIQFQDGSQLYFDGAKDLFRYYYSLPNKNDQRTTEQIAGIYLTDYYSTRLLPIEQLFLVQGSDVNGPMGPELIPVAGEHAARTFLQDHQGQKLLRFDPQSRQLLPQN